MPEKNDKDVPAGKLVCGGGARVVSVHDAPKDQTRFVLKGVREVRDGQGVAYLAKALPDKGKR